MKQKMASAVRYIAGDEGPRLLLRSRGRAAERLVELARDAGVAVVEEPLLAGALDGMDEGAVIPRDCWEMMARILAFVMQEEQYEEVGN